MESSQKVMKEESIATSTDRAASSHAFPVFQEEEFSLEETTKKCCSDCRTTKTPLWRSGPSGPKSLCNACGIRYRKKRPAAAPPKGKSGKRRNLMPVGQEIEVGKRLSSPREWGEVERAALLLMALSCGAVFA